MHRLGTWLTCGAGDGLRPFPIWEVAENPNSLFQVMVCLPHPQMLRSVPKAKEIITMVYEVSVSAEYAMSVLVRAESPEEAQDEVWAMLSNGKINPLEETPDYNVIAQVEFEDDDEDIAGEDII